LPLAVTGCLAVVRLLMGWSYRVLAEQVNVSAGWRWVCQLYDQRMPNFRTIRDREALLTPKTLAVIQAQVVHLGQAVGVTSGARLRVDSSVTESDIHYPTDSSLLNDAARVLSRLVRQARLVLDPQTGTEKAWFRDRHRQARRLARQIGQLARKGRKTAEESSLKLYRHCCTSWPLGGAWLFFNRACSLSNLLPAACTSCSPPICPWQRVMAQQSNASCRTERHRQ
jgi:IS5 family transposase